MTGPDAPDYQWVASQLRSWISSGRFPVGDRLTIGQVRGLTSKNAYAVRRALADLVDEKVLKGGQGKAFEVIATPEQAAQQQASLEKLTEEVGQLRTRVAGLEEELAKLRKRMGQMEADLASAAEESHGGKRERAAAAADSGRR